MHKLLQGCIFPNFSLEHNDSCQPWLPPIRPQTAFGVKNLFFVVMQIISKK